MKIIGHRGAAGLALENTVSAITAGVQAGVDAIEIDVRATKDDRLVLSHDATLERTHGLARKIRHMHSDEISSVRSDQGHHVATLAQAVEAAGNTPLFIEGKSGDWVQPLVDFLRERPQVAKRSTVISFNRDELALFHQAMPEVRVLVLELQNSFDAIAAARLYGFDGIDVNYWTLNPLSYWLAKRHGLDVVVFTVNKPLVARFLRFLFPRVAVTTNVPHLLQFLRGKSKKALAR